MSKVKVSFETVEVDDGQGVLEGDFELRIKFSDGTLEHTWPSSTGTIKVDRGGAVLSPREEIATYEIAPGKTLSKSFTINVEEVDAGPFDQDDVGTGKLTFNLSAGMMSTSKSSVIPLNRLEGKDKGRVIVKLVAEQVGRIHL
jgi:hypothetical protein